MSNAKINPSDLIVGAQVMVLALGISKVTSILQYSDGSSIITIDHKTYMDCKGLSPIPITPERLAELGFEKGRGALWGLGAYTVYPNGERWSLVCNEDDITLSGIHHLQLIMKGLTGELLKIKS